MQRNSNNAPRLWLRRRFLLALPTVASCHPCFGAFPSAQRGRDFSFPRDHGSHPLFRTEWWYITGWLHDEDGNDFGVQVTFFRTRPDVQEDNSSAFAPKQLLFAHVALSDPRIGRLRHDQRSARAGFSLAQASEETTDVQIDDWFLHLEQRTYHAHATGHGLDLALDFEPTQPPILEGQAGFSRKGPSPNQASYYYSIPHLAASGTIGIEGKRLRVTGQAWLDHEWSSNYLPKQASGWDWTGINFDNGGALMAFCMRGKNRRSYWASATLRESGAGPRTMAPQDVWFEPLRRWRSPRTGVEYPVAMRVKAGNVTLELQPLLDDQELDSRASTGAVYWEGAVRAIRDGQPVGYGYLELTGYASPLRL